MRQLSIIIILLLCLGVLGIPKSKVSAQATTMSVETFTPEVPLPGVFAGPQTADDTLLSRYVRAIYIYFIWVVGIVATVMVMYGGIRWVSAAGNPGQIKEARDIIDNAVIGVIIGLTSVVLLNIINPKLTNLAIPKLGSISKEYYDGAAVTKICPYVPNIIQNIECGKIKNIGKIKDRNGQVVDNYCMGVWCPYAANGIPIAGVLFDVRYQKRMACRIQQSEGSTYYSPGFGCSSTIPITGIPGETRFENSTSAEVTNIPFNISFGCGHVSPVGSVPGLSVADGGTPYRFGYSCRVNNVNFTQNPMCYIVGNNAILKEAWVDGGQAVNAKCPPVE